MALMANNIERKMQAYNTSNKSSGSSSPRVETPSILSLDEAPTTTTTTTTAILVSAAVVDALTLPQTTPATPPPSTTPTTITEEADNSSPPRGKPLQVQQQQHLDLSINTTDSRNDSENNNNNSHSNISYTIEETTEASPTAVPEQQLPLRRITSSLAASSEVVRSLFGESMGPCWGDFSCSHFRIRGRLFATSHAILFHTNLLGFERRICLLLRDVVEMDFFRATSIRIETMDLETYIFKSFNDREQVLHVLNGLKILAEKKRGKIGNSSRSNNRSRNDSEDPTPAHHRGRVPSSTPITTRSNNTSGGVSGVSSSLWQPQYHSSSSSGLPSVGPSSPLRTPNRQRALSDSIVRVILDTNSNMNNNNDNEQHTASTLVAARPLKPIGSNEELANDDNEASPLPLRQGTTELEEEEEEEASSSPEVMWTNMEQIKNNLHQVGLESLSMPCSLEEYDKLFLADEAQYPLDYYQKEYIKDINVSLTGWDLGADGVSFHRTITFTHPIKNSMGIGPSSAQTTRQQRLRKFPGLGLALENKTFVEGLPGADCFYIQDMWMLEYVSDSETKLSVHFDIIFKKRSLFKNIIQKSVQKETKQWIAGYVDMVQGVLGDNHNVSSSNRNDIATASINNNNRSSSNNSQLEQERKKSLHQPLLSSSRSSIITNQGTPPRLESSIMLLVEKMELAYRIIAFLVFIILVVVIFFGYQMLTMQQCLLDLRSDLLQQQQQYHQVFSTTEH